MPARGATSPDEVQAYVRVTDFTGGEISPLLEGRRDLQKYYSSCRQLENFLPLVQGGVTRRPGTALVAQLPVESPGGVAGYAQSYRLAPFVATEQNAYVVVFECWAHPYGQNDVIAFGANEGILAISSTNASPYTLSSPYSQTLTLQWAQSVDVMWIVDGTQLPQYLSFVAANPADWTIDGTSYLPNPGPWGPLNPSLNATATTLTLGAATGSTTLTASATAGINGGQGFLATDVGRQVRMLLPDPLADSYNPESPPADGTIAWGSAIITGWTSSTVVTVTAYARPSWPSILESSQWQLGAFSNTTGYPAAVGFWGGRLWYGNTPGQPNTAWGSYVGNYVDFNGSERDDTVTEADAVTFTLADAQADGIRWIKGAGSAQMAQLGFGTRADEHILMSGSYGQALAPDSVQGYRESSYGSRGQSGPPIGIGKALIFPRLFGKKLNEWQYAWQVNGYLATDLLQLAEHLAQPGGINRMAWQQEPAQTLWFTTDDGRLLSLAYDAQQNVRAWARHQLGGSYNGGPPQVLDVCVIPNPTIGQDELWLVVLRTLGGASVYTLEVLQPPFRSTRIGSLGQDDAWFVDCGVRSVLTYGNGDVTPGGLVDRRPTDQQGRPYGPPVWGAPGDVITIACDQTTFVAATASGSGSASGKPGSPAYPTIATSIDVLGCIARFNGGTALVTGWTDSQHVTATVLSPFSSTGQALQAAWTMTPRFTVFGGLSLLAGETVSVYGDSFDLGDQVVSATGTITLPQPGFSYVLAGEPYRSDLETVQLETELGPAQTALGKVARIHRLYASLFETVGGWHGPDASTLDAYPVWPAGVTTTLPPPLFTGNVREPFPGGATTLHTVHLLQDRPLPFTCLALVAALEPTT
jgi:hypothetical protein